MGVAGGLYNPEQLRHSKSWRLSGEEEGKWKNSAAPSPASASTSSTSPASASLTTLASASSPPPPASLSSTPTLPQSQNQSLGCCTIIVKHLFLFASVKAPRREMSSKATFGFFAAVLLLLLPLVQRATADCLWEEKGLMVATGEVTGFDLEKKKVEVCTKKGKLKLKKEKRVKKPLQIACNGCRWKGEVICDGEVIQDLYIWWFETHCSKGRLSVVGRSWGEVNADPRFK